MSSRSPHTNRVEAAPCVVQQVPQDEAIFSAPAGDSPSKERLQQRLGSKESADPRELVHGCVPLQITNDDSPISTNLSADMKTPEYYRAGTIGTSTSQGDIPSRPSRAGTISTITIQGDIPSKSSSLSPRKVSYSSAPEMSSFCSGNAL